MNTTFKRCLHLGALLVVGAVMLSGSHAYAAPLGLPVSSCQTLAPNTKYFLTQNILNVSGTCFFVGNNTSLDMLHHTIKGTNSGDGISDGGSEAENVVIVNGTITGFEDGIDMFSEESINLTVDNVTVTNNSGEGIFQDTCCNTLTNIKATGNGDDGIDIPSCCNTFSNVNASFNNDEGVFSEDCCNLAFGVTASFNGSIGIELDGCCSGVENSTASSNDGDGIFLDDEDNSVAVVTANSNNGDGILVEGSNSQVDHATANNNNGDGIIEEGEADLVSNSTASGNSDDGIDITDSIDNIAVLNTTVGNGIFGLDIACQSNVVKLNSHGNSCTDLCEFVDSNPCTNLNNTNVTSGCSC